MPRRLSSNSRTRRNISTINYTDGNRSRSTDLKKEITTSNRPGSGPSKERQSFNKHSASTPTTTYNVIPIKVQAAYDADTDENPDEIPVSPKKQPRKSDVTSDNKNNEEDDDNLPLSKLCEKLVPKTSDSNVKSTTPSTSKGKLKPQNSGNTIAQKG